MHQLDAASSSLLFRDCALATYHESPIPRPDTTHCFVDAYLYPLG